MKSVSTDFLCTLFCTVGFQQNSVIAREGDEETTLVVTVGEVIPRVPVTVQVEFISDTAEGLSCYIQSSDEEYSLYMYPPGNI